MTHTYRMTGKIEECADRITLLVDELCSIKSVINRAFCLATVSVDVGQALCYLERELLIRSLICNGLDRVGNNGFYRTFLICSVCSAWLSTCSTETRSAVCMDTMKKDLSYGSPERLLISVRISPAREGEISITSFEIIHTFCSPSVMARA